MKDNTLSLQLTLYLDGRLDGETRARVERLIESDADVRNRYDELRRMRDLLASRPPIPANPWLAERVMNRIHQTHDRDELPLPRRLSPAAAAGLAVFVLAIAALAWMQREQIIRYVDDTGTQVQMAYEETILKGWIMPLFQRTDQDQVLEFAMFGTLPLDGQDGTLLRVDETADRGFRVELTSDPARVRPAATVNELYDEIRPTSLQRKVFDTLFLYAQRQLESAVLMNSEREIAVNPAIGRFNTVILSGIAASLDPEQLVRFENFLEKRNTPYTFVAQRVTSGATSPPPPQRVLEHFRSARPPEDFVVLTADSFTVVRLGLDMDSLRRLMKHLEHRMPRIEVQVQDLLRHYTAGRQPDVPAPPQAPRGVTVMPVPDSEGGHAISISIDASGEIVREIEREFGVLREQITVLRREGEQFRREGEQLQRRAMLRVEEELRLRTMTPPVVPTAPGTRQERIRVYIDDDSIEVRRMRVDSTQGAVESGDEPPLRRFEAVPLPPLPPPELQLRPRTIPPAPQHPVRKDTIDI